MHNHAARGKRFCPLMQEMCMKGWTSKMGKTEDGFPIEGACAAWQPVSSFNKREGKNEEVYDCSVFGWTPDLLSEIAKEVFQNAASTDKVATEIQKNVILVQPLPAFQKPVEAPKEVTDGTPRTN